MNKIFIAYLNILFWEIHVQLFYIFKLNFLFRTKLSESFIHSILNVLFVQEMYNKYFVPVLTYLSLLWWWILSAVQFSSVTQLCPTLCNPMNRSTPGLLSITNSWSSLKLMSIESVMPSSHLILCRPLLLLPPIPPSIRVFSNESSLCMRWPKY